MNYEKKYKGAIERAKVAQETYIKLGNVCARQVIETIFPELKESEDERMAKFIKQQLFNIKKTITENYELDTKLTKAIDWLEKQGEQKPIISNNALREGIAHFGITQYQIDNWLKKYVDVEKQDEQILANSAKTCKDEYSPKFRVGDTIKCKYDDRRFTIKSVDFNKGTYTYTQEGCGNDIDYADEEFELVEQKPADEVKPKFKIGDWITIKQ